MAQSNRTLLGAAAAAEAATGVALIVIPHVVAKLLLGAEVTGVGIVIARVAGIALLALGLGCWLGQVDAPDRRNWALVAMLVYDFSVTIYLAFVGLFTEYTGALLWPAIAAHALLTVLLGSVWLRADHLANP